MPTIFTRIIGGEIPGHFVWRDEHAVGFLSINPLRPGHTLVVPRQEVDHWIDLDDTLAAHLFTVARSVGQAQERAFKPARIGMAILGMEVPHVHLHLVPIQRESDMHFSNADPHPDADGLDRAAEQIRAALRELGYGGVAE
ncbi:MAG: HIT family protein [Longimicrobiaceae bacterium]